MGNNRNIDKANEKRAAARRRHNAGRVVLWCVVGLILFGVLAALFCVTLADGIKRTREEQTAEIVVNGSGAVAVIDHEEFFEIDTPAEGIARQCDAQRTACDSQPVHDIGSPDWNLNTSRVGWDGRLAEEWELDLYARIVYLEFWGTSQECTEAGADSILRLWELGEYGDTLGELLSAQYAPGYYVYSPYAYVWDWTYDAEGLADIRALCEERFANGPEWCAPYFRLWYYHDWAVPAYQLDNVYFSVRGWY